MRKIITILACLVALANYAHAQENTTEPLAKTEKASKPPKEKFKPRLSLGVNAILEGGTELGEKKGGSTMGFNPIVRPGISFDVQLSKHSGLETGLYYRMNYSAGHYITSPDGPGEEDVWKPAYRDNRLLVPIYYKFYSRILNFAAGADFSFNLAPNAPNSFSRVDCAFVLRISKDFTLYKGLYIEPLLQGAVGNIIWLGVGVGLKYRF